MKPDNYDAPIASPLSGPAPAIEFDDIHPVLQTKWQKITNLLAECLDVPVALVMKTENACMEVSISSQTDDNPYRSGDKEHWEGLYCQTVIQKQEKLLVVNALNDPQWDHNPDLKLGMVAYMGLPINFPDGRPFGTLCVLDNKEHHFSDRDERILRSFRDTIETDLHALQMQAELHQREKFIRAIVDNLPIGITVNAMEPDAIPAYMNDLFPKYYRTTREAIPTVEAFWEAAYPDPETRTAMRARVESDCASGDPDRMYWPEIPIIRDGEETTFISARNAIIPDSNQMISLVWDVTEQKKAEEELALQYHMQQAAGRMARVGGWSADLETNICIWSDFVAEIHEMPHGYAPSVEEGINFYAPEWRDRITEVCTACAQEGRPFDEEMQILTRTGERVWIRTVGEAVRDKHGKITELRGAFQDISRRKQNQKLIHHLNQVLRAIRDINQLMTHEIDSEALLKQTCEILISTRGYRSAWAALCSADGILQSVTQAGLGKEFVPMREDMEKGNWPECCQLAQKNNTGIVAIFDTHDNCTHCPLARAYHGTASLTGRLRHEDRDYGVLVVALPQGLAESDEERALFREVVEDLAFALHAIESRQALQQYEDQLRQAQKMEAVGRLAGGVAHDFNNLLMGILGFAELARDRLSQDHPARTDLQEVITNAQRSAELTRQLLAFARKQEIVPTLLNLNETIPSMLKLLQRLLGEDIDILWMPSKVATPVMMDPAQVDQLLANLCINARDAIEDAGKLTIETENVVMDSSYCKQHPDVAPGNYVMIAITDNGCGMSAETQEHIFEPFYTTKESGHGTGLGLATVYGIVNQNKGFIHVYSELGQGTTFKIYVPMADTNTLESNSEDTEKPAYAKGSETILLAEDEVSIRKSLQIFLRALGYNVLAAATPQDALQLAASHTGEIPLLITDVVMPDMNGRELSNRLKEVRPHIKTLFMSGYTANVITQRGILESQANFLQKPIPLKVLSAKVRDMLDT